MKHKKVRVNNNLHTHVVVDGVPHPIEHAIFARSLTPRPLSAIIDDMEQQLTPDVIGQCALCADEVTESDDWVIDGDDCYCCSDCFNSRPVDGRFCETCGLLVLESDDWVGIADKLYCSDKCSDSHFASTPSYRDIPLYCDVCGDYLDDCQCPDIEKSVYG